MVKIRPTSFVGILGLVTVGIIVADVLIHPAGTKAAANGIATVADPTYNALLGNTTQATTAASLAASSTG